MNMSRYLNQDDLLSFVHFNESNKHEELVLSLYKANYKVFLPINIVINMVVLVLNSIEIWFIRNKFRRYLNPLIVIFFHLSVADLLQGIIDITMIPLVILRLKLFKNSYILEETFAFLRAFWMGIVWYPKLTSFFL